MCSFKEDARPALSLKKKKKKNNETALCTEIAKIINQYYESHFNVSE